VHSSISNHILWQPIRHYYSLLLRRYDDALIEMVVRTALGHREFVLTKLYRSA
jgi:hypothetical protein